MGQYGRISCQNMGNMGGTGQNMRGYMGKMCEIWELCAGSLTHAKLTHPSTPLREGGLQCPANPTAVRATAS